MKKQAKGSAARRFSDRLATLPFLNLCGKLSKKSISEGKSAKKIRKDFLALTLDLWYNIAQ